MPATPKTFQRPGLAAGVACTVGALAGLEASLPASSTPHGPFVAALLASSAVLPGLGLVAALLLVATTLANRRLRPPLHRACLMLVLAGLGHVAGTSAAPLDPHDLPHATHRDDPPALVTGRVVEPPRWRWTPPAWGDDSPQRALSLTLQVESVAMAIDRTTSFDPTTAIERTTPIRASADRNPSPGDAASGTPTTGLSDRKAPAWRPASGLVLLSLRLPPSEETSSHLPVDPDDGRTPRLSFGVGDRVELTARLRRVSPPSNPGEPDRTRRLWRSGVARVGSADLRSLSVIEPSRGMARRAERFRAAFADAVRSRLGSGDEAALVTALAVGERGDIGLELQEHFQKSGLAHLLALSGLHIGVLVASLLWLLKRLLALSAALCARVPPKVLASALALPATAIYVVAVGAPPSTLRAGIAAALVLLARVTGRTPDGLNTWGWCLTGLALLEPPLLHLVSTQLSFAGVLGILTLTKPLRELVPIAPPNPENRPTRLARLGEAVLLVAVASTAAGLSTAPLTAVYFEQSAILGTLANVLAWPSTMLAVPAGAAAALLFTIHPALATPFIVLAGLAASLLAFAAEWVSGLPGSSVPVRPPGDFGLLAFFVGLALLSNARHWPRRRIGAVAACGLAMFAVDRSPDLIDLGRRRLVGGNLEVTFLSVGQGDATVVRFPRGSTLVLDAGGTVTGRFDPGERIVTPYLHHQGVRRIDVLVASHPHPDHIGGLFSLLDRFRVDELWHNGHRVDPGESQRPLVDAARARGVEVVDFRLGLPESCDDLPPLHETHPKVARLRAGDPRCAASPPTRAIDGVGVEILHPLAGPERAAFPELGENDNSLVLRLVHGNVRVLLPGDLEAEGEALLLARGVPLEADILKAPHHGSRTSSTEAFVQAVRPRHVVFCVGENNRFGFPSPVVDRRFAAARCERHRTDLHGAVTFVSDGRSIEVRRHLEPPRPHARKRRSADVANDFPQPLPSGTEMP